jgi:predicted nucleotidyltransferase
VVVTLHTLRSRRADIIELAREHGASNLRVFGSVARGEATERSDVDLLVDMDASRSMLDLCALEEDLERLLGRPVEIGTKLYPRIRDRVLQEAVALSSE